jgi:hypothetical protein
LRNDFDALRTIESEMSIDFLSLSSDGLPLRSAFIAHSERDDT